MIKGMEERGVDHAALLDTYIRAYNNCLKGRPTDMTVGLHLCRGNFRAGMHFSEGGYDRIAIKLFQQINVDCYYLEYDTPRAGSFEPLKFLPPTKTVVLGLITSKFAKLEDLDDLVSRVRNAAAIIASGQEGRTAEEALGQCVFLFACISSYFLTSRAEFVSAHSAASHRTRTGTTLTRPRCVLSSSSSSRLLRLSGETTSKGVMI